MLKIRNLEKTFNPGTINAKTALNGFDLTCGKHREITAFYKYYR